MGLTPRGEISISLKADDSFVDYDDTRRAMKKLPESKIDKGLVILRKPDDKFGSSPVV